MQETKHVDTKVYRRRHQRKKVWKNFVRVMACIVVFCTTYALILPAITQEKETFCGMEAHTHEDACFAKKVSMICDPKAETELPVLHTHDELCYREDTLICALAELEGHVHDETCYTIQVTPAHSHDESCMTQERGALLCLEEEQEGHTHSDECFAPGTTLCCTLEEKEGHVHGEGCYQYENSLSCTLAEGEGHAHGEGCYSLESQLTCEVPEGEEHTHEDGCYIQTQTLTCTQPETEPHTHGEGCYTQLQTLVCQLPEEEGHAHSDSCYELVQVCQLEELEGHTHTDDCYEMISNLVCTLEENTEEITVKTLNCTLVELAPHTHGEGCYDENGEKICTITEAVVHQHTEDCIQISQEETLTCQLEEHEHTLECYSDPTADLETAADWEKTFAEAERTGLWREDTLTIAKTQLGYHESTKNYIVEEDERVLGYTRYGAWYGIPYGDWCAMYASFCLSYAGVEGMPLEASCPNWIQDLTRMNLYHSEETYVPVPADLIFFDWNANGEPDHVGLVVELDGEKVKTIEGNSGDSVAYQTYNLTDSRIMGYGAMPLQAQEEQEETVTFPCGMQEHTHAENCYDEAGNLICQLPEHTHSEECNNKQLFYSDDTIRAYVTIKDVEELPQNLSVRVWPIDSEEDPETFEAIHSALVSELNNSSQFVSQAGYYGMELLSGEEVYQLPETADITIHVEFAEPLFTAEDIENATQMDTYQMVSAEPVSTFALRNEEQTEEDTPSEVYLAESVDGETYDSTNDGLTALDFRSSTVTTFAVALTSNVQTGNHWYRVQSVSEITSGDTYMIVSAEGNYALSVNGTSRQAIPVTIQSVKDNTRYYTIEDSNGNVINSSKATGSENNPNAHLYWTITKNSSNYRILNQGASRYLSVGSDGLLSGSSTSQVMSYQTTEKCWRISNGTGNNSYYLRNIGDGSNFSRIQNKNADAEVSGTRYEGVSHYYTRDMLIFKLVDVSLTIPNDVVTNAGADDEEADAPGRPHYADFIDPSDSKTGDTAVNELKDGKTTATVSGKYYSDPATSNLEINFRPNVADLESDEAYAASKLNDGKVMTDKSVIYGDDDYGAFSSYPANTFGVALSALGQEYPVPQLDVVRTPIDVVFVLDVSGSMTEHKTSDNKTRMEALYAAFNEAATHILEDNTNNRIGVAIYSSGAWEMLPLGRYVADKDSEGIMNLTRLEKNHDKYRLEDKHYLVTSSSLRPEGSPNNTKYANIGLDSDVNGVDIVQGVGTYTQAGIATGYGIFEKNTDTSYTTTIGSGDNQREYTVQRQPIMILLSDGEPTHATSNYMDPLNGPHYSDGKAYSKDQYPNEDNTSGVQGYYTVLSANYFKRMTGIHYQKQAMFYTIGMGIKSPADDKNDQSFDTTNVKYQGTGDMYKRAVLNPTTDNVNNLTSNLNDTTKLVVQQFKQLMQSKYNAQAIMTQSEWPDPWYGIPHIYVPVLKQNPYADNYSYADGAYFGKMSTDELADIFDEILEKSFSETEYGFVLYEYSSVHIKDVIGDGMEVKGTPVLRYNGVNYTNATVSTGTDRDTNEPYTQYTYSGTYEVQGKEPKETIDVSEITVKIFQQADGRQRVYMMVPDTVLPVYFPETIGEQFYYEALPVRLIYQVGLTEESEQEVLDLLETGGEKVFYTNAYGYRTNADGETVVDPYSDAELHPSLNNPFYHDQYDKNGNKVSSMQYHAHHSHKEENTTDTSDHHVDCTMTDEFIDGVEVLQVDHDLGNNGKLVFTVETVDIPVEKTWTGVTPAQQSPVNLTLYVVEKPEASETYLGSLVEGKTLTLSHSTDSTADWKGTFTNLPKLPDGQFYAVAEAVPNGFVVSYGDNEIFVSLGNGAAPIAAALVTDYDDEGIAATVTITNAPLVTLPETGGVGTTLYTTGGLLLMMVAVLLLLHNQKNKRRKGAEPSC